MPRSKNDMEQTTLFRIECSTNPQVTGVSEKQIDSLKHDLTGRQVGHLWDAYQDVYSDFLPDTIRLDKFVAHKKAKPTDLLSSRFLSMNGLFISAKLRDHLASFKVACSRISPVTVRYLTDKSDYFFLNTIACRSVNYAQSRFVIKNEYNSEYRCDIAISSLDEYRFAVNNIRTERGWDYVVDSVEIVLYEAADLFRFEIDGTILISENLKQSIEASGLTGIVLSPYALKVEFSDCRNDR